METPDEMSKKWEEEIKAAGVPTEEQMRDAIVPTPKTAPELAEYINTLVERPHDYGTCVYAMSHAAVAAFNYVASKLGVTGFQASCADMNILKHTRNLKRGRVIDYRNLLYPQYIEKFETRYSDYLEENKEWLREEAAKLIEESPGAHPEVLAHWKRLAAL